MTDETASLTEATMSEQTTCRNCFQPIHEAANPQHDPSRLDSDAQHWVHEDGKRGCGEQFWGDAQADPQVYMGPLAR